MERAGDSLAAAKTLLNDEFFDFAASRAYYAMYYVAEALLAERGLSFGSHSATVAAFGKEYAKANRVDAKFHRWLISSQNLRNVADYGVEAHVSENQAGLACEWADEFIRAAAEYLETAK